MSITVFKIVLLLFLTSCASPFAVSPTRNVQRRRDTPTKMSCSSEMSQDAAGAAGAECHDETTTTLLDPEVSVKFKILTCSSTSCAKKRQVCGLDSLATYGAMFRRIQEGRAPDVQLEESPCLGSCKMSPCVAVEHEDYVGTVALEGMNGDEFTERVFHSIMTEQDADRVWGCVENAILQMTEEEDDEDVSEYDDEDGYI